MSVDRRMPVVAAVECRRKLARWRDVSVAVHVMTDLVRIFPGYTRQRELRETIGRGGIEFPGRFLAA